MPVERTPNAGRRSVVQTNAYGSARRPAFEGALPCTSCRSSSWDGIGET